MRTLSAFILCSLSVACYRYDGIAEQPAPGSRVSVRLTEDATAQLGRELGPQVRWVEGDVVAVDSSGLQLRVRQTEDDRRVATDWKGERLALPRSAIADLRARHFAPAATGLLGGLIAGGAVAAYEMLGGSGGSAGPGGLNPGGSSR